MERHSFSIVSVLRYFGIIIKVLVKVFFAKDHLENKEKCLEYHTTNIIGHLNINSVRKKLDSLIEIIKNYNIFVILESKLDESFPKHQFKISGYKCFRLDRNKYGGGLIYYISEGTLCKVSINQIVSSNVEMMTIKFH